MDYKPLDDVISKYKYHKTHHDERLGRKEGEKEYPPTNADKSDFTTMRIAEAARDLRTYDHALRNFIKENNDEIDRNKDDLDTIQARQNELEADRQEQLERLSQEIGQDSTKYKAVKLELSQVESAASSLAIQLQRPVRVSFTRLYLPLMVIFALIEVPVNRLAFELFFLETPVISLGLALGSGALLMLFAHFFGLWVKQSSNYESLKDRRWHYIASILIILFVIPYIYVLTLLRQGYVELIEREADSSFATMLSEGNISGVTDQIFSLELGVAGFTLLLINILIFFVASILSFLRHDAHPDYEALVLKRDRLKARLENLQQKYEKMRKRIDESYKKKNTYLSSLYESKEKVIKELKQKIDAVKDHRDENIKLIADVLRTRILAYQNANKLVRNTAVPKCFHDMSSKEIIDELLSQSDTPSISALHNIELIR